MSSSERMGTSGRTKEQPTRSSSSTTTTKPATHAPTGDHSYKGKEAFPAEGTRVRGGYQGMGTLMFRMTLFITRFFKTLK